MVDNLNKISDFDTILNNASIPKVDLGVCLYIKNMRLAQMNHPHVKPLQYLSNKAQPYLLNPLPALCGANGLEPSIPDYGLRAIFAK